MEKSEYNKKIRNLILPAQKTMQNLSDFNGDLLFYIT